jgi:uncharacterized protein YkwD
MLLEDAKLYAEVRMRRLVGVVVVAAMVVELSAAIVAFAEVTTPTVRARARRNGIVRVSCFHFKGMGSRDLSTIEYERATADGPFRSIRVVERPRRYQTIFDVPGEAGVYWYRARVVSDTGTSAWSVPFMVDAYAAAPTRTPRPTTTPEPVDDPTPTAPPTIAGDPPLPAGMRECAGGAVAQVLDLTNAARDDGDRAPLALHPQLNRAARTHSIDMARAGVLTHDGWLESIRAAGYPGGWLAENIAVGYGSPVGVVTAWLESAGHRGNILNPVYRDVGVGCVVDRAGATWWTQDFGG